MLRPSIVRYIAFWYVFCYSGMNIGNLQGIGRSTFYKKEEKKENLKKITRKVTFELDIVVNISNFSILRK